MSGSFECGNETSVSISVPWSKDLVIMKLLHALYKDIYGSGG